MHVSLRVFWTLLMILSLSWSLACSDGSNAAAGAGLDSDESQSGGSSDADDGWDVNADGGLVTVEDGGVSVEDESGVFTCYPTRCADKLLECGDCVDNDGDGAFDSNDKECLGPCDNTEGPGLSAGVGGVNRANCRVDCYFDFGNGPGNDDCHWDHRCDELEPAAACSYDSERFDSRDCPLEQSERCTEVCLPFTPNGCDCFGCCTFPELAFSGPGGTAEYVWIGNLNDANESVCTFDGIGDRQLCPACTPVEACNNECGRCEVCVGKPEVPADCLEPENPGGGADAGPDDGGVGDAGTDDAEGTSNPGQCLEGEQPCGQSGQSDCERNYYCITGCCQYVY